MEDGHTEKKITYEFSPFKPVQCFMYRCQGDFDTSCLKYLLDDHEKFGFIIVDGNGATYATLQGNVKKILLKYSVTLPNKHNKGG